MVANHDILAEQAERLERLLPRLLRRLFPTDLDHASTDLPLAQLRVCTLLQTGPRSMSALSEELAISVSAVTQLADRLEQSCMVERVAEPDDRRVRQLRLTPRGAETMRMRRERRICRARDVIRGLSPAAREDVLAAIETLTREAEVLPLAAGASPDDGRQVR